VAFKRLQGLGFAGSERTVRRAVAEVKANHRRGRRRVYRPWIPEPGMWAQWDSRSSPHYESLAARCHRRAIFPPQDTDHGWARALVLLCRRLNPKRRLRSNPHVIKRKMPKWHVKRAHLATWPQPTGPAHPTILRI
jgi:hypothetical protein